MPDASNAVADLFPNLPMNPAAKLIPHNKIFPSPLNARTVIEGGPLEGLAASIKARGLQQPLKVRPRVDEGSGEFEIIMGERRHAALGLLIGRGDLKEDHPVPCTIAAADDVDATVDGLIENLQREDIPPLDEAKGYKRLIDGGMKTKEIEKRTGVRQRVIQQRLTLLNLSPAAQEALNAGSVTVEQARELARAPEALQATVLKSLETGTIKSAEDMRNAMFGDLSPVDIAFFKLERYTGEYVEDPETKGRKLFADTTQFLDLQKAGIDAKKAELEKRWPWVNVEKSWDITLNALAHRYTKATTKAQKKKSGAVIVQDRTTHAVAIHTGLVDQQAEREAAREAEAAKAAPKTQQQTLAAYDPEFLNHIADLKDAALQLAISRAPEVALKVIMTGLNAATYKLINVQRDEVQAQPVIAEAYRKHLQAIYQMDGLAAWQHLTKLRPQALDQALAVLAAGFVSHEREGDAPGESDLYVTIALEAKADITEVFDFAGDTGSAFVEACQLPELERIAADLGIDAEAVAKRNGCWMIDDLKTELHVARAKNPKYVPPWLMIATPKVIAAHLKKTAPKGAAKAKKPAKPAAKKATKKPAAKKATKAKSTKKGR